MHYNVIYRKVVNGTLASLHTLSKAHLLTSSLVRLGVFRNGVTCNVVKGLPARLSLVKLVAPRNISLSKELIILSERSRIRKDERLFRNPFGRLARRFLERFNRVIAGMALKVSSSRKCKPQFEHSNRYRLVKIN